MLCSWTRQFTVSLSAQVYKWVLANLMLGLNAVKCNLTELTTKSACVPLEVSGVDTFVHMSEFHMLVDCSIG